MNQLTSGVGTWESIKVDVVEAEVGGVTHTVGLRTLSTSSKTMGGCATRGLPERELDSPRTSHRGDSTPGAEGCGLDAVVTSSGTSRGGVHRFRSLSWRNSGTSVDLR